MLLVSEKTFKFKVLPLNHPKTCNIISHPWPRPYHRSLAVRKGLPFLPLIDYHISKLMESGVLAKMKDDFVVTRFYGNETNCDEESERSIYPDPFDFEAAKNLFGIIGWRTLAAFATLAFEMGRKMKSG